MYIYAVRFYFPLRSSPLRRLRRHGCGALLLLRASLRPSQKADRCPCSASAVSSAGCASAAQSRTRGRLPSQSRRPCGRLASSPGGRAKYTPVSKGKLCGKTKFFQLCLTTNFAKTDAGTLASPCGGGGTAPCAVTERGGSHARGKVQNVTFRLLPPRVRGRWPAGPERAKKATKRAPACADALCKSRFCINFAGKNIRSHSHAWL